MPYDVPDQAGWKSPNGFNGCAADKVGDSVTSHEAWGLGSYCFFNVNPLGQRLPRLRSPQQRLRPAFSAGLESVAMKVVWGGGALLGLGYVALRFGLGPFTGLFGSWRRSPPGNW